MAEGRARKLRYLLVGVILALDGPGLDVYGMEVLLSLGAASLELREVKSASLIAPAPMTLPVAAPVAAARPVSPRAFARRTVAGWILEHGDRVAAGRAAGDLYGAMAELIDAAMADGGAAGANAVGAPVADLVAGRRTIVSIAESDGIDIGVPLVRGDELLAVLVLPEVLAERLTRDLEAVLDRFGAEAAVALVNARRHEAAMFLLDIAS